MNSHPIPHTHQQDTRLGRLGLMLTIGMSIFGLVMVLFWLDAGAAQASSNGSSSTAGPGVAQRRKSPPRNNQSGSTPNQTLPLMRNDSRYSQEPGKSGGKSTAPSGSATNKAPSKSSGSTVKSKSSSSSGSSGPPVATRRG